jgi:hypothetical protein
MSKLWQWVERRFAVYDLSLDYFSTIRHVWVEVVWGASVIALAFVIPLSLGYNIPRWGIVLFFVGALLIAGYHSWRRERVRLIPKLGISKAKFVTTPVTRGGHVLGNRTFVQLVPECLTEAPVYECTGYLQKVWKLSAEGGWIDAGLDQNLTLQWGNKQERVVTQHPRAEHFLNILYIWDDPWTLVPCVNPDADIPLQRFTAIFGSKPAEAVFRFDVQITSSERIDGSLVSIAPVEARLEVKFKDDPFKPSLEIVDRNISGVLI